MAMVKLSSVAREVRGSWKGDRKDVPVVGLEHLEPDEIWLRQWDVNPSENTFTKAFKKGQLLFGRRRAYQKKLSLAPCDGICSGDITVIEAIPGEIEPRLLPFILRTDQFFDFAIRGSGGSLSPRVKWVHIADYEFDLPPIEKQRELAELLWAANDLKESYKKLITASDEMLKAKFREMFGDPFSNSAKNSKLGVISEINPRRMMSDIGDNDSVSFVPMPSIHEDGYLQNVAVRQYSDVKKGFTCFKEDDVLFAKITPCMENGKGARAVGLVNGIGFGSTEFHVIRSKEGITSPSWILALTRDPQFRLVAAKNMTGTGGQKRVPASFLIDFPIDRPNYEQVRKFDAIYQAYLDSRNSLKKSIADIDAVIKGFVNV